MTERPPDDDEIRIYFAELYLFGELPPLPDGYLTALENYVRQQPPDGDPEATLERELTYWRSTVRYARHAAGLPPMEPPSFDDIARAYRAIAGDDLTIVRQMRDN